MFLRGPPHGPGWEGRSCLTAPAPDPSRNQELAGGPQGVHLGTCACPCSGTQEGKETLQVTSTNSRAWVPGGDAAHTAPGWLGQEGKAASLALHPVTAFKRQETELMVKNVMWSPSGQICEFR